jgi:hypothetical protein
LELLLLLTALFASLTGSASGDRQVRAVQGVAVVQAAGRVQAAVQPARAALPQAALPARMRPARTLWSSLAAAPIRSLRLVYERRLE